MALVPRARGARAEAASRWPSALARLRALAAAACRDFEPEPRACSSRYAGRGSPPTASRYHVGVDGLSLWLVLLTTFLTPLALLGSWTSIQTRVKEFNVFMLLLEAGMIGVFVALDLFLFYMFWEAMLIPMYFLIGIWGHERRIYAAVKFFLYTMAGSVLMLVAFLVLYRRRRALQLRHPRTCRRRPVDPALQMLALPRLRAGLRDQGADVAVPHLAARRARRGAHRGLGDPGRRAAEDGRLRLPAPGHPALPRRRAQASRRWIGALAVVGIVYGALVSLVQPDLKKLVAYSSVSHLGFVMLGIAALHHHRRGGRGLPDAQPRHLDGRAVLPGRHALRAAPHARSIAEFGGLQERDALVLRGVPARLPVLDRGARHQRLRGRVPDPDGLLAASARAGRRWPRWA